MEKNQFSYLKKYCGKFWCEYFLFFCELCINLTGFILFTLGESLCKTFSMDPEKSFGQLEGINSFLRHSKSRQWTKYEWMYSDVEKAFFNQNTFADEINKRIPQLKKRMLTMREWRKIRKLIGNNECRRFSANFINKSRASLDKCRRRWNVLQQSMPDIDISQSICNNSNNSAVDKTAELMSIAISGENTTNRFGSQSIQLFKNIVVMRKLLAAKSQALNELKRLNTMAQEQPTNNGLNMNMVIKVVEKTFDCNNNIMQCFEKLNCFEAVKETLLLTSNIPLAPTYFRKKQAQSIFEKNKEYQSSKFVCSERVVNEVYILLEYSFNITECDKIAVNQIDYFAEVSANANIRLQTSMSGENFQYFEQSCMPVMVTVINKVCFVNVYV